VRQLAHLAHGMAAHPARWSRRAPRRALFTTIWIPLASLKALRLGRRRFQHCPAGHHWTMVTQLDQTSAGPADLETAAALHDIRIP
jgi:hypothetical protein